MGCGQSKGGVDNPKGAVEEVGEKENSGFFAGIVDAVQDKIEDVQEQIEDIADAVGDAVDLLSGPFEAFEGVLEVGVVKTLRWISPKAAEKVRDQLVGKVSALEGSSVTKVAKKTVRTQIMEQKDEILDFCQDVLEDLKEGAKPIHALKKTFRNVGTMILQALKKAISACVAAVVGCFSGCLSCVGGIGSHIAAMIKKLTKMVKNHLKKLLNKMAPAFLVAKLPWDWQVDTVVADKPKVQQKKAQGIKTAREEMGKPDREPGAEKAAKKKGKNDEDDDSDLEDDGEPDSDSDDEEEDDDAYEDFDDEAGGDSDEDADPATGQPKEKGEEAPAEDE